MPSAPFGLPASWFTSLVSFSDRVVVNASEGRFTVGGIKKGPECTPAPLSLLRLEVVVELHCYVAWASVDGVIRDAVQCAARGQTNEGASQRDGSANYADTLIA